VALINTAHNLEKHDKPAEQRSGRKRKRAPAERKSKARRMGAAP